MKLYDKTVYESTLIRLKKVSRPRETADETINRLIDEKEDDLCRIAGMIEHGESE